jgi:hypothetical protein
MIKLKQSEISIRPKDSANSRSLSKTLMIKKIKSETSIKKKINELQQTKLTSNYQTLDTLKKPATS